MSRPSHNQLLENMVRHNALYSRAQRQGITLYLARVPEDANRVAIHLLKPGFREIEDALEQAEAKGFDLIVIHSPRTWPAGQE